MGRWLGFSLSNINSPYFGGHKVLLSVYSKIELIGINTWRHR